MGFAKWVRLLGPVDPVIAHHTPLSDAMLHF
jgi:hypothetical protein